MPATKPKPKPRPCIFLVMALALLVSCVPSDYVNGAELLPIVQGAEASATVNAEELTVGSTVNDQKAAWARSNAQSWTALREQIEKLLRGDTTPIPTPEQR